MDEPTQTTEPEVPPVETVPKEQYYRLAADFENYRKAMEQQLMDVAKFGSQSVVLRMVDVMDHIDQAVSHASDAVKADTTWFRGVEQIDLQFHETMKQFGVERIETAGKPFDPSTMEAVSEKDGSPSQHVHAELLAGYTMHGRVIRPARVIIYK